ncbi:MAG: hypothetical protein AAGE84_21645 [Cyanobacteria bacterium P01_G01_bin.39]
MQLKTSKLEQDLLPMAHTLDIGVTAWSPLASGSKLHLSIFRLTPEN